VLSIAAMAVALQVECTHASRTSNGPRFSRNSSAFRRSIPRFLTPELAAAASRADAAAPRGIDLAETWQHFIDGRLRLCAADRTRSRQYILAHTIAGDARPLVSLNEIETSVLSRVLCGEPQKEIAIELGIACSTTSKWFTRALEKLNISRRFVPLPLVTAAQSWTLGQTPAIDRRSTLFDYDGVSFLVLSIPRPIVGLDSPLTASERAVAQHLVEGDSRRDIAARRFTSAQTVATQLGTIFSKLGLRGRFPLIRLAGDRGWLQ
jgi:DNA-binding NarL/FixJ family response regulator